MKPDREPDNQKVGHKNNPLRIRYQKTIQESVVRAIANGELLLEEAMDKYGIMSKKTIVRWLKRFQEGKGID